MIFDEKTTVIIKEKAALKRQLSKLNNVDIKIVGPVPQVF